jgi:hypothetical protein
MTNAITIPSISPAPNIETAWQDVHSSFERFFLTAGIEALEEMIWNVRRRISRNRGPPILV